MNRRLLDRDPDELARHLLEHGRGDKPTDGAQRRTVEKAIVAATIGAGLSTASMTSGAAAAASWLVAFKWIGAGAATAALALGVTHELRPSFFSGLSTASHSKRPTASASDAVVAPIEPGAALDVAPSPAPLNAATTGLGVSAEPREEASPMSSHSPRRPRHPKPRALEEPPTSPFAAAPAAAPSSSSAAKRTDTLEQELRILERARVSLDDHIPDHALTDLDGYARLFPGGSLGIEATALRIEALLALGQRSAGRALGQSFLARYPKSPAAMRVRRLLDEGNGGTQKP